MLVFSCIRVTHPTLDNSPKKLSFVLEILKEVGGIEGRHYTVSLLTFGVDFQFFCQSLAVEFLALHLVLDRVVLKGI